MLDVGWSELVLIMALAVLVIGPKELPTLMLGLGRLVRRLQYVKYAMSQQFEDFMKEADMNDIRRSVNFEEGKARFEDAAQDEALAAPAAEILPAAPAEDGLIKNLPVQEPPADKEDGHSRQQSPEKDEKGDL